MGKFMRKAKITGDVAVMELISQSPLGVRTRAKTHALQQILQSNPPPPPTNAEPSSYLQLRNRRLEKVLPPPAHKSCCRRNPNPNGSANPSSGSVGAVSISCLSKKEDDDGVIADFAKGACKEIGAEDYSDLGIEPSFGENNLDFEVRGRSTRESAPCSLIRESVTAGTPGSTTRRTAATATNRRMQNAVQRNIPTTQEMEEFFARAEQQQRRLFTEKYNFDVVNDLPLPGRYEWVSVTN